MKQQQAKGSRAFLRRGDLFIILCLLLVAGIAYGVFWLFGQKHQANKILQAQILCDGKLVKTVDLTNGIDEIFSLDQRPDVTFEVKQGKIRFINAKCPDKLCEHAGFLGTAHQTAACIPNRVSVRIVGKQSSSNVDAVAG